MTEAELREIEERASAANAGPLRTPPENDASENAWVAWSRARQIFRVRAEEDVPRLAAEVRRLNAEFENQRALKNLLINDCSESKAEVRYLRAALSHLARLTMNPDVYELSTAEVQDLAMGALNGTWKPE